MFSFFKNILMTFHFEWLVYCPDLTTWTVDNISQVSGISFIALTNWEGEMMNCIGVK